MSNLRGLIRVVSAYEDSHQDILRRHGLLEAGTKIHELYMGMKDGQIRDDSDARAFLYPEKDNVPDTTYSSIKSRLIQSTVESLGELDNRSLGDNDYTRSYLRALQYVRVLRMLLIREEFDCAQTVALLLMKISERYSFTDELAVCLEALMQCYAVSGNRARLDACVREYDAVLRTRAMERTADSEYSHYYAATLQSWSQHPELIPAVDASIARLRSEMFQADSHALVMTMFRVRQLHAEMMQDHGTCRSVREEVERYYVNHPHLREPRQAVHFATCAMNAAFRQGDGVEAERLALFCEEHATPGTQSWFQYRQRYLVMALRMMNTEAAHRVHTEAVEHRAFTELDDHTRNIWSILGVYVDMLRLCLPDQGLVREQGIETRSMTWQVEGMEDALQKDGAMKKDLQGLKVVAMIARVLSMFMKGDYDGLVRRDESLQTLRRKRLRTLHGRLDAFIRCMHAMVESNFRAHDCEARTRRLIAELRMADDDRNTNENQMLEIIPFDELWLMMLRVLRERQEASPSR